METFLSVASEKTNQSEIVEKKSRFLSFSKYVETSEEAEMFFRQIKLKYKDAKHVVFAYRLLNTSRTTDDGEPSGTAGKPILNLLEKLNLFNIIVVVVRYFGGIKLGAGPLLRTYLSAAQQVLAEPFWIYEKCFESKIKMSFKEFETLLPLSLKNEIKLIDVNYQDEVCAKVIYPQHFSKKFKNETEKKQIFYSFKVSDVQNN